MPGVDMPELAVLLLVDGSGSMGWSLREGAMSAAVVLHEVLDKNNVSHAIVEHRAIYGDALLEHKVLVGFGYKKNDKYNIPMLEAREGTREGLTLYWAEKYFGQHTSAENKVILMISDGAPAHATDSKEYCPPASNRDTANAAKKISQRGTNIIAIALDDVGEDYVYQSLLDIYPNVVSCTDTKKLPGQICRVLSKLLES
jgi:nitric oxide reductase activation protein